MIARFPQGITPAFRRRAFRTSVLALTAGMLWLGPVSARDGARTGETGLSALEVWKGQAFRTGRADFSEGFDKGWESLGNALVGAVTPQLKDRLELTPPFRTNVRAYAVTIGYRETAVAVLASAMQPGATIEVAGSGPDGAALKRGGGVDNIDLELGERRLRADALRSFQDIPVGKSRIAVAVVLADGSRTEVAELAVARLDADLTNAEERLLYFRAAALDGRAQVLSRAIEAGADVDMPIALGTQRATALVIAAGQGFEDAVDVAIRAGADVDAVLRAPGIAADGASPLLLAVGRGDERIVRLLLDAGADRNFALPGPEAHGTLAIAGGTPLVVALDRGQDGMARLLIEEGADVNRVLPDAVAGSNASLSGVSPLILAAYLGKADLVDMMIEAGADVNYRIAGERRVGGRNPQTAGLTALQVATGRGHTGIADRLKAAGATP